MAKKKKFSAATHRKMVERMAKASLEGNPYDRPAGTKPAKPQPTGPLNPHAVPSPLPRSGTDIFPAIRVATRRLQSHVGPSPQDSRITRRRRI
jgi:hypothetical protein